MSAAPRKITPRLLFRRELVATVAVLPMVGPVAAQTALPRGGSVVSGQARIGAPDGSTLTITQGSPRAVIDWNSFSVGAGGTVNFVQPSASSAILNRVTGAASSTIAGEIRGNGEVFLVNPNGIAITPSGAVRAGGGFVASTLDITNGNFNAGNLTFAGSGAAGVSNAGTIAAGPGGLVGLIGGSVSNSGTIVVPLGKVGLGAAQQATLNPTGDGFLQVAIPAGALSADGRALIDVSGRIRADGGLVAIKAATAEQAVRNAVNVSGTISARSVSGRNGAIVLDGGVGGRTVVSGKLIATGGRHAKGGAITVTGNAIELRGALLDASGGTGGGTVLVGTDAAGAQRATTTTVDAGSMIKADATVSGNGGTVKVWADDATSFAGRIFARGGPLGGNGGNAEVSGKSELTLAGDYSRNPLADLSAPKGLKGTVTFDPGTVNIVDQASLGGGSALNGPDTFTAQFISGQLASANVTIDTNNATGANGAAGDINVGANAHIAWSGSSVLTLNAAHGINFASGASITGTGAGGLVLRADSGGTGAGTINFSGGTQVSLPLGSVNLYYNPASNRTAANGGTNPAAGTVNSTSYTGTPAAETWSSFVTAGTLTPWRLVNSAFDLQNINNNLTANYALGTNINAAATATWNLGAGFVPLGTDGAGLVLGGGAGFAGQFDGLGHTITGLSISRTLASDIGLFGFVSGGVSNVGVVGATINGAGDVGGIAGVNTGAINGSFVTGAVSGLLSDVGGLVGWNKAGGSISNAYSLASSSALVNSVGGLVGQNDGSIATSYAAGPTVTLLFSGGLAASNAGSISQSYFDTVTTLHLNGVGLGSASGVTGLATAVLQNGTLPTGFSAAVWTATLGLYPQLNWQFPPAPPPATTKVVITVTDPTAGNPVYGTTPTLGFKVTDTLGNVLCTTACGAFFSGTPLIDATVSSASAAGTSGTTVIAQGSMVAASGFALRFVNETLLVAPRPLTITASNQSKTYGAIATLGTTAFTTSGLVNGDTVSGVTLSSTGAGAAATVAGGPYAITASAALGSGLTNYTISYANGLLTVLPAPVTVTALGGASTYGSSPGNPGLSASGLQNGQAAGVLTGLSNSFGITGLTSAGSYALTVAGTLTNANYVVTGLTGGSWTVNPAPVTVTALGGSSAFGASPGNPGLAAGGLQNGQSVGVLTGLRSSFGITGSTAVGSYTLNVVGALTNPNYIVAGLNTGLWTVVPPSGAQTNGSRPSGPGLAVNTPQNPNANTVLSTLGDLSSGGTINVGPMGSNASPAGGAGGGASSRPAPGQSVSVPPSAVVPSAASPPAPPALSAQLQPSEAVIAGAGQPARAGCAAGSGIAGEAMPSASGSEACGSEIGGKAARLVDFALSKLNRNALLDAFDLELSDMKKSRAVVPVTLVKIAAGAGVVLTAGFVSWLMRSGLLLSALLSSMPIWQGFDPLVVVQTRRRSGERRGKLEEVDRMFDETRAPARRDGAS